MEKEKGGLEVRAREFLRYKIIGNSEMKGYLDEMTGDSEEINFLMVGGYLSKIGKGGNYFYLITDSGKRYALEE